MISSLVIATTSSLQQVSEAFSYPFRSGSGRAWAIGLPLIFLLPLGAIPLLGYAVAVVRLSVTDPESGPPPWRPLGRLLWDGLLMAIVISLLSLPFALVVAPLASWLRPATGQLVGDPLLAGGLALVIAGAASGLPWGILLLVLMPPATVRYAVGGAPGRLFEPMAAVALVGARFARWNLVVVAIVTAWAIGLSGLGLALLGVVPGIFYALLVSARATATLADG